MAISRPFATIILAGGEGTRMGATARHKVCFEVRGVPVILRALETYNLCGSTLNIVVVGRKAGSVLATVAQRFPGTAFAFQPQPRGTGDAARAGAEVLERTGYTGDVLVAAGDKVIEPRVIHQVLAAHARAKADLTLATAKRPPNSTSGTVLESKRGNLVGILEEAERQQLAALAEIGAALRRRPALSRPQVDQILARHCGEKAARALAGRLWGGTPRSQLMRAEFERGFSPDERRGRFRMGGGVFAAAQVLARFGRVNLSVYLFRAPVLYDALHRLKPLRSGREEYLTDVLEILAQRRPPARVAGCVIADLRDLMAFNDPQELAAIEEVYAGKEGRAEDGETAQPGEELAPAAVWEKVLQDPPPWARRQFGRWYGEEAPWGRLRGVVAEFIRRHGGQRRVAIVRSPGRINLLGRHIDHQGGPVNLMAVDREIILVAAPRADDVVLLGNVHGGQFPEEGFRISDLIAKLDWGDWQRLIDGPRLRRLLRGARGNWANYVQAAILGLQDEFHDRRLCGLDIVLGGDIPMGAGLGSSSALVVAAAEAARACNRLPLSAQRLVGLCGAGEWFVGTRGGAGDHAAIRLSQRGRVTRVAFFPFRLEGTAPFFPQHDLVVCNSGIYAAKSSQARNVFNAKVTAYHLGRVWLKLRRPDLAPRIAHLRDVNPEHLGLSRRAFAHWLDQLPPRLTRRQAEAALSQMLPADRDRLEGLFRAHDAPAGGYPVRGVILFGLAEMARARQCLDLLRRNDAPALGRLMTISHDGDRVSPRGQALGAPASAGPRPSAQLASAGNLAEVPGQYSCSLPELDRMVDLALGHPGVEGAQLAGAGLGGCVMALVRRDQSAGLVRVLADQGLQAEVFRPIAGARLLLFKPC